MAASNDRHAGTNSGRIGGQVAKIRNWMRNADFEHVPGGDIDRVIAEIDLASEIDPQQSASDNYQRIKADLGLKTASDLKREARNADDKAADSARRWIREHIDEIDAGEAAETLQDIREEFGEAFVAGALDGARTVNELGGAPEANDYAPSAIANANRVGATADTLEITHEPTPEPERPAEPATAQASLEDAAPAPEPASAPGLETPASPSSPGFIGILGKVAAPVKLVLIVLYVALALPWDATDPEVTAA